MPLVVAGIFIPVLTEEDMRTYTLFGLPADLAVVGNRVFQRAQELMADAATMRLVHG